MTDVTDRLRRRNQQKTAENEANRNARAARLQPDVVAYWTKVILTVLPTVPAAKPPCDYAPWLGAFREFSRNPPYIGTPAPLGQDKSSDLIGIAATIAQPGWPEPRPDLIEFALTFLEADVMLFRSGYIKRHLIRRLQQSPLSTDHVARLDRLLRRAVQEGARLQEFLAYRQLAGHLVVTGALPDLPDWLAERAKGAILANDKLNRGALEDVLRKHSHEALAAFGWWREDYDAPATWGLPYPDLFPVVLASARAQPDHWIKYNAYLMLSYIRRRQAC